MDQHGRSQETEATASVAEPPIAVPSSRSRTWLVPRRLLLIAVLIAPLLIGELAVRGLIAIHHLPVAAATEISTEVAWTNLERAGPVDVLILGDSLARQGIEPGTLESLAGRSAGRPVTVFNLATPGAGFSVYRGYIEQLAKEGRLPKVVLIGVSTVALQRSDRASTRTFRSPFGRLLSDCGGVSGVEDVLSCRLESVSALWRWRGQLGRLFEALGGPVPTRERDGGMNVGADGFAESRSMRESEREDKVDFALENTAPLKRAEPDVDAYADLAESLRAHGVSTVAVLIPYAPPLERALEAREPGWRVERRGLLNTLGARADMPILRPRPLGPWWTTADSHDARHLSARGARKFTRDLWQMPAFRNAITEGLGAGTAPGR